MAWTRNRPVGVTWRDAARSCPGYTLFAPVRGTHANLLDAEGRIVWRWHHPQGIQHAKLAANGNLLIQTQPPEDAEGTERIGASSGALIELDWNSTLVWEYVSPFTLGSRTARSDGILGGGVGSEGDEMATIPRLAGAEPVERIVETLREHGGVIVEDLLDAELLARFNAELDPHLAAARPDRTFLSPAIDWFFGKHTRHLTGVAAKSRVFASEVLCHPIYLALADAVLGPSCASYQLNVAQVLDRGPGAEPQLLHRDEAVWVHLPRPHPEIQLASVIALVDFDADTGATRVVPGSHRWPLDRQPTDDEIAAAEMRAGSAVVYLGSTIHGGGPNTSADTWRRGMHMSFTVGWLRTEENHSLSTPPEVARTLPRRAQELLGYAVHDALAAGGGYLGAVDLRDPVELLASKEL